MSGTSKVLHDITKYLGHENDGKKYVQDVKRYVLTSKICRDINLYVKRYVLMSTKSMSCHKIVSRNITHYV